MSVLTKEECKKRREFLKELYGGTVYGKNEEDLLDTIHDRDGTIETLQAKLEKAKDGLKVINNHLDHDVHSIAAHGSNIHIDLKETLKQLEEV